MDGRWSTLDSKLIWHGSQTNSKGQRKVVIPAYCLKSTLDLADWDPQVFHGQWHLCKQSDSNQTGAVHGGEYPSHMTCGVWWFGWRQMPLNLGSPVCKKNKKNKNKLSLSLRRFCPCPQWDRRNSICVVSHYKFHLCCFILRVGVNLVLYSNSLQSSSVVWLSVYGGWKKGIYTSTIL